MLHVLQRACTCTRSLDDLIGVFQRAYSDHDLSDESRQISGGKSPLTGLK